MSYYKRDMLSIKTRQILAQYLNQAMLSCLSLEPFRQHLSNIPEFDCIGLFRYLDRASKGFLSYQDFTTIMGPIDPHYLQYCFARIDGLKVGEISKIEFCQFLVPKQNNILRELVTQRMGENMLEKDYQTMPQQISVFSHMLQTIIIQEIQNLAPIRIKMLSAPDYSIAGVLNALDNNRHGFIVNEDIRKFLAGNGIYITEQQSTSIIQAYDSNMDGKLHLKELEWAIEGLEGKRTSYIEILQGRKMIKQGQQKKVMKKKQKSKKKEIGNKKPSIQRVRIRQKQNDELPESFKQYERISKLIQTHEKQANQIDKELIKCDIILQRQNQILKKQALIDVIIKNKIVQNHKMQRQVLSRIQPKIYDRTPGIIKVRPQSRENSRKLAHSIYNIDNLERSKQQVINDSIILNKQAELDYLVDQHLKITNNHLKRSEDLRQKIRQQRQIQRKIHDNLITMQKSLNQNYQQANYFLGSPIKSHKNQQPPTTANAKNLTNIINSN